MTATAPRLFDNWERRRSESSSGDTAGVLASLSSFYRGGGGGPDAAGGAPSEGRFLPVAAVSSTRLLSVDSDRDISPRRQAPPRCLLACYAAGVVSQPSTAQAVNAGPLPSRRCLGSAELVPSGAVSRYRDISPSPRPTDDFRVPRGGPAVHSSHEPRLPTEHHGSAASLLVVSPLRGAIATGPAIVEPPPVVDRLMACHRLAEAKRAERRMALQQMELNSIRAVPRIDRRSAAMVQGRSATPVYVRLAPPGQAQLQSPARSYRSADYHHDARSADQGNGQPSGLQHPPWNANQRLLVSCASAPSTAAGQVHGFASPSASCRPPRRYVDVTAASYIAAAGRHDEETDDVKPQPSINAASHRLERSVEDMLLWERERQEKLKRDARERELQLAREVTAVPQVNAVSEALVANRQRLVEALGDAGTLEAERHRRMNEHHHLRSSHHGGGRIGVVTPVHSRRPAASTMNPIEVSTRLFDDAEKRRSELRQLELTHEILSSVDPKTGQVLFNPLIPAAASHLPEHRRRSPSASSKDVFRNLHEQPTAAFKAMTSQPSDAPPSSSHQFTVGAYSHLLAELKREREGLSGVSLYERLTARSGSRSGLNTTLEVGGVTQRASSGPDGFDSAVTFKPVINEHSRHLDARNKAAFDRLGGPVDRVETLFAKQRLYEAHRERSLREKQLREAEEILACQPPRTAALQKKGDHPPLDHHPADFLQRQTLWAVKRDHRLQNQRSVSADNDVAE